MLLKAKKRTLEEESAVSASGVPAAFLQLVLYSFFVFVLFDFYRFLSYAFMSIPQFALYSTYLPTYLARFFSLTRV